MNDLTKEVSALEQAAKRMGEVSDEMGRTIVRQQNEIILLKEQIRVADVAYNYLHKEHARLVKANDDEEPQWEALIDACREVKRVLESGDCVVSMPHTYKKVCNALKNL